MGSCPCCQYQHINAVVFLLHLLNLSVSPVYGFRHLRSRCLSPISLSRQIWDLESKVVVDELRPDFPEVSAKAIVPYCTCLCWSNNGSILYSG